MGERIKKLRKVSKMTQEQFANRLRISRNFVNQVESGKKQISNRTIKDICEAFNVNEEWLRTGEGEMFAPLKNKTELLMEYLHIDEDMRGLVEVFFRLPPDAQKAFVAVVKQYAQAYVDQLGQTTSQPTDE